MKICMYLLIIPLFFLVLPVRAQEVCGGEIQLNDDCKKADSKWALSCCPSAYEAIGVSHASSEAFDAVNVVCRNKTKKNVFIAARNYQPNPVLLLCGEGEVLSSVDYKKDKKTKAITAVSVGCQNKGTLNTTKKETGWTKKDKVVSVEKMDTRSIVGLALRSDEDESLNTLSCLTLITDTP